MTKRLWLWFTTPRAVRLAQDKRRLEHIARDFGCSRTQATRIVNAYFRKSLEENN